MGIPWRMTERSQDSSCAPDVDGAEPSCSCVTQEIASHHEDPPLPSGHLLKPRTERPGQLGLDFHPDPACLDHVLPRVSPLTALLRACASLTEILSFSLRAGGSPFLLTVLLLHVQCLVHTSVLPGTPLWRAPCFPRLTGDPARNFPRRGLVNFQRRGSQATTQRLSSLPPRASIGQGQCYPLLAQLVCVYPPLYY